MSDKEKVLKVWEDARAFQICPGEWIVAHGNDPNNPGYAILGPEFDSEEAAWQNAAESLPPQPAQERCTYAQCLHPMNIHWIEPDGKAYHCRIPDCPCEQYTPLQQSEAEQCVRSMYPDAWEAPYSRWIWTREPKNSDKPESAPVCLSTDGWQKAAESLPAQPGATTMYHGPAGEGMSRFIGGPLSQRELGAPLPTVEAKSHCPRCGSAMRSIRLWVSGFTEPACKHGWHDAPDPVEAKEKPMGVCSVSDFSHAASPTCILWRELPVRPKPIQVAEAKPSPDLDAAFEEWWAKYALTDEAHQDSQRDARAAWHAAIKKAETR